jgi:hypothetical protein
MHRIRPLVLVAAFAVTACAGDRPAPTAPEDVTVPVFDRGGTAGHAAHQFRAPALKGANEIPARESGGAGTATFSLARDGLSIDYRLIVANIDDVTQSHIHLGPPDANGPIVVFLFGLEPAGVTTNGILAQGTFTASDLVGPLAGAPLADLVEALRSGGAYVNVHTLAFPGGEIRAQVR